MASRPGRTDMASACTAVRWPPGKWAADSPCRAKARAAAPPSPWNCLSIRKDEPALPPPHRLNLPPDMKEHTHPSPVPHSNNRILVIDDNRAIHEDFRKIFRATEGKELAIDLTEAALFGQAPLVESRPPFEFDSSFQGQEGLALIQRALEEHRPYAMAFVDVRMPPGWDGIETIGHLWKQDPDLQVVICTAFSAYTWEDIRERLGRTDKLLILKKPFDGVEARQFACSLTEKWNLTQ